MSELLIHLRSENPDIAWTGSNGLFQRAADEIERLRAALIDVSDLIDGYVDIRDHGPLGPIPNDAMRAQQLISEVLS